MNFIEIQKIANRLYGKAIALEQLTPRRLRKNIQKALTLLLTISVVSAVAFDHFFWIVSIIVFTTLLVSLLFEAMYNSYYYLGQEDVGGVFIDFDLAFCLSKVSPQDVVHGFFDSTVGITILLRCGVSHAEFGQFLQNRNTVLSTQNFTVTVQNNFLQLGDIALALIDQDKALSDFLFAHGIQKKELLGITDWITEFEEERKYQSRWWSKDKLSRIPGIGEDWSYGQIYTLKKYEKFIPYNSSRHYHTHSSYGVAELQELEAVLSRSRDANVLLVGNDMAGDIAIVSNLNQMIKDGTAVRALKHKRIIVLDKDLIVSANETKAKFESEFLNIMREAVVAGNIVIVFDDFPSFISGASSLNVDLPSLITPYLASPSLQTIALSDNERFHSLLEKNPIISQHFETVLIKGIDDSNTIKVIENEVIKFERNGMFFTYPAILAIVTGAERYFPNGVMPDKAVDLLLEIVPKLQDQGKNIALKSDVLSLIEVKTGIPMGEVRADEKEKLLNLETILHKRIIGQDEAIVTISNAIRRSRSGVTSPDRPIGSFLFLGPTGVGKTETTKALADAFFGAQANILRLDMSEYSAFDSVSKLIGSFESHQAGVLPAMLTEHPYGVLLLDEFEKTTKEVMNIFLQILDEGYFSDMAGKRVNARNLIIIATSNAGSDLIWETMKDGGDISTAKDLVVDSVIKQGIFKPELLNRFDGVILFHPLDQAGLRKIAELMLGKLHNRLAEKGINLKVDQSLIDYVVSFGTDPKFGARPMNRAIQEKVEEAVAVKIIAGSIPQGQEVVLGPEELK